MTSLSIFVALAALAAGSDSPPPAQDARAAREVPLQPAPAGTVAEVAKPAVDVRLWIVAFDADFPADKLPISPRAVEEVNRELGRGPDAKGRMPTLGLAIQVEMAKFQVDSPTHILRVRDGGLVTDPVTGRDAAASGESASPPWNVISAPRLLVNLGQEAMVSVGRPVEYMTKDDDGCLRVVSTDGITEGMELHLTAAKILEKGIRFTGVTLKVSRVESRRPIDGVPFDVGVPVVDTRETQLDLTLDDGRLAMMPLPTRAGEPVITVFLLANRVEK